MTFKQKRLHDELLTKSDFRMLKVALVLIGSALVSTAANAGCPFGGSLLQESPTLFEYRGDINGVPIGMTLSINGNQVEGRYYYAKYLRDITLKGSVSSDRVVELEEYNDKGTKVASITGSFATSDPKNVYKSELGCEVIVGKWHGEHSPKALPLYVRLTFSMPGTLQRRYPNFATGHITDKQISEIATSFLEGVRGNKKKRVASVLHYPFTAWVGRQKQTIHNEADFLSHYDEIISKDYISSLTGVNPKHLGLQRSGFIELGGSAYIGADLKVWPMGGVEN